MGELNYTKGKWYVALNGKVLVKSGEQYTEICSMPFSSAREADQMPESEANAHLIASAPALYEALKKGDETLTIVQDIIVEICKTCNPQIAESLVVAQHHLCHVISGSDKALSLAEKEK